MSRKNLSKLSKKLIDKIYFTKHAIAKKLDILFSKI